MKPIAIAAMTVAMALTAAPVLAKGGQDNYEREQALQAEFEKSSKESKSDASPSFFDQLFGSDEKEQTAGTTDRNTGKRSN